MINLAMSDVFCYAYHQVINPKGFFTCSGIMVEFRPTHSLPGT